MFATELNFGHMFAASSGWLVAASQKGIFGFL